MNTKTLVAILTIILITLGVLLFQSPAEKSKGDVQKPTNIPTVTSMPTPTPTITHVSKCPGEFLICYVSTTKKLCKKTDAAVGWMTCDAGNGKKGRCCPQE